ncbi:HNH endonuclease signature motif containing protein [Mycobacterium sp. 852002-51971_SCH5477799-a]|uniref:HNH endonuclease signature motif containing protein n=1 Tax=Mycobacterium sp. 852002-51971_SCH5477799-a TaxID=1834106 RepID=UPI0009EED95C
MNVNGRKETRRVHRLVLEAFVGPAPSGTFGCHLDGDPANNRLNNLRWDTQANNLRDVVSHGRHHSSNRTHCVHGHEFTPENTRLTAKGHRRCIRCDRALHAKRRAVHGDRIRAQKRALWQRRVEAAGRVYKPKGPVKRGTRTHCANGHERTPENTIYEGRQRRCAICRTEQNLARYRQKREAQGQRYFPGGVRTHCYKGAPAHARKYDIRGPRSCPSMQDLPRAIPVTASPAQNQAV